MSSRLTLLLISVCLLCSSAFSFARALSANAEGAIVDDTAVEGAIAGVDEDDDFESSFITDFELADAPDPNLKKYKDPEFMFPL